MYKTKKNTFFCFEDLLLYFFFFFLDFLSAIVQLEQNRLYDFGVCTNIMRLSLAEYLAWLTT